jgi:hypothetical protein
MSRSSSGYKNFSSENMGLELMSVHQTAVGKLAAAAKEIQSGN